MNNLLKILAIVGILTLLLLVAYNVIPKHVTAPPPTPDTTAAPVPPSASDAIPSASVPNEEADNATAPTSTAATNDTAPATATSTPAPSGLDASIEAYIKTHPQVIIDAVNQYQQDQVRKQTEQAEQYIASRWTEFTSNPADPVVGNPKGDVTIVEFFDYSCGYCKHVLPFMLKVLETDPNVRIIFKEFPILSQNSEVAAKVALATYQLNPTKYLELHKALFNVRLTTDKSAIEAATSIGLDAKAIEDKMKAPEVQTLLTANRQFALEAGVRGTPAFIINGKLIPGVADYETLKSLIQSAREKK